MGQETGVPYSGRFLSKKYEESSKILSFHGRGTKESDGRD